MTAKNITQWMAIVCVQFILLAGCAGIQPYEPRDYREEGPQRGVFTGTEGEFVIIGQDKIIQPGGDAENTSSDNPESAY